MGMKERLAPMAADFQNGIRKAALSGMIDESGNIAGTSKVFGYVCNIHEDDEKEFGGTVDVQEYNYDGTEEGERVGFHEGVRLSAIQNNKNGYRIIPQLYSDVVITQDPSTLEEYVIMFSHINLAQIVSCEKVVVGVTERESPVETENGLEKDYDELNETGAKSQTTYSSNTIRSSVGSKDGESYTEITPGLVKVNGDDTWAVRYNELYDFLSELCQKLASGTVPALGSPLSTAPQIGQMASKIQKMQSKKVKLS